MILQGNYSLSLRLGEDDINVPIDSLKNFVIVQDIDRLIPSFKLGLSDSQGAMAHFLAPDKQVRTITVESGKGVERDESWNTFKFIMSRRKPQEGFGISSICYLVGLSAVPSLLDVRKSRGWAGSVKDALTSIALEELMVDEVDISPSLDGEQLMIQDYCTTAEFLYDLKQRLEGLTGVAGYRCFIKNYKNKQVFVCRSLEELCQGAVVQTFVVSDVDKQIKGFDADALPAYSYSVMDNYQVLSTPQVDYEYFDYDSSEFVSAYETVDDFYSLSQYLLIDRGDLYGVGYVGYLGRNSAVTEDFSGDARAYYYDRLINLVQLWILVPGMINMCPGDVVKVFFPFSVQIGSTHLCQHSGFWLIKRVVHMFGHTHRTRLLLVRAGIDTGAETSLVPASKYKVDRQ